MNKPTTKQRFDYIDQFRGFVGVLMLLGHSAYYFNSIWYRLDPLDPLFPNNSQFILRFIGYLCAPGFLMMAGAMVWWSYTKRIEKGVPIKTAKWHLIQRGLFLILMQMTWVNSSWGGFTDFRPWHFGIISSIGISVILLTLIIGLKWQIRLFIGVALLLIHPFLLQINYSQDDIFNTVIMQTFVDAGTFNKYPVIPWFSLAVLGSVMATGWLQIWKLDSLKIKMSYIIGFSSILLAVIIRLFRGYGNINPFSEFGSISFFLDQKYPPSLFMNLLFFGLVVIGVGSFIALNKWFPKFMKLFSIPGKVPLFFYGVHLAILGIVVKRFDFFYREGEILYTFIGLGVMLIIMFPLSKWFYNYKRKSNNPIIKMI
jgi:uncharacterized membrane protein